jgi:carboxyl-terminal processing protease
VLLVPVLLALGVWLGGHPDQLPGPLRDALVDDEEARVYDEALEVISDDFYRPVDPDRLLNRSLEAAVESLDDRFSAYFSPDDYQHFQEVSGGQFEGVGMTVQEVRRGLKIATIFDGSPADRAGLRKGDLIVAVDGRSLEGMTSEEAVALIKGPAGTTVTLTVRTKDGQARDVELRRETVDVPVVESELRRAGDEQIAHVALSTFSSGAHGELGGEIRGLLDKGADGVVLDLRDNGGGLLNEAVLISSLFVPDGVIVSTKGRSQPERVYEAQGDSIDEDIPVVVLVNSESASASEIVTGALQDHERATVVGERTFGKGVFQEIKPLSNGGALDITVGEYYTPDGRNLGSRNGQPGGVVPDVTATDDPETEQRDEALDAALRQFASRAT